MPDMQKEVHPELEQSEQGDVSEMREREKERKASASQEAEKVARETAKSVECVVESLKTSFEQPGQLRTVLFKMPLAIGPLGSLAVSGDDREEPTRISEPDDLVCRVPREKEESREPSDAGQADRSNQGIGKAGNVDGADKEGV